MKDVLTLGQQQAAMGAAGFEKRVSVPRVALPVEPIPPGVFVKLPDIGQQQEQMDYYGRLRQAREKTEAAQV